MASWYVDEGLAALIREWKKAHSKATVYTIADSAHSSDPDVSQHARDDGGSKPGDDKGEVDAGDFMPGNGVTDADLDDLFDSLRASKDKRILYVIRRDKIFSSVVEPWKVRPYKGKYHGHCHVSVNDNYDNDQSDWKWEKLMARKLTFTPITAQLPTLQLGDEDAAFDGYNRIARVQALLNWYEKSLPDLDTDGVYGPNTARKLAKAFGGNGRTITPANLRVLLAI